jgi:putative oxidoreductase
MIPRMPNSMSVSAKLDRLAASGSQFAPTLLRVVLGGIFLGHAYAKVAVFTFAGTVAFFDGQGLPAWSVYPVLATELLASLCLIVGFQVRLAALALVPVMLGALMPHVSNRWMFSYAGARWEHVAFLIFGLVVQVLVGKGPPLRTR